VVVGALLLVVVGGSRAAADPLYSVSSLGAIPWANNYYLTGINASGQIAGDANVFDERTDSSTPFLYSQGKMTSLPVGSVGQGINDQGQIAPPGAVAINNAGQTVNSSGVITDAHGKTTTIPVPGGAKPPIVAWAMNNKGEVVGSVGVSGGESAAFIYSGGKTTILPLLPGVNSAEARAVNDLGQVVGMSMGSHAFLYSAGKTIGLGVLGGNNGGWSIPLGINNHGQVVGWSSWSGGSGSHAFLYEKGVMRDLNSLIPQNSG
jgi:probable HAF family extracellular repeat protein